MGRKRTPGLVNRDGIWHIDKVIRGKRLCESTGESRLEKAEEYLSQRIIEARRIAVFGDRKKRTFREAATRHLNESTKTTLADDAMHLAQLDPFIGALGLEKISMETLQPFIEHRQAQGKKAATINHALQVVRHVLFMAAKEWRDENGNSWLLQAPAIRFLPKTDSRAPYPLSWKEQARFFKELPAHLERMALFKVNSGTREQEVVCLEWDWEVLVPELDTSVFILPPHIVKNRDERLVVLNQVAASVIEGQRAALQARTRAGEATDDEHRYVFTYKGRKVGCMNSSAWRKARKRAELPVRVHDLKHTFGRRLRAAGVGLEDRQDLLGHRAGKITTHYSGAELANLIESANRVCGGESRKSPALVLLRRKSG